METFETHIAANKRATVALVAGLLALAAITGGIFGGAVSNGDPSGVLGGVVAAFVGAGIGMLVTYSAAPRILLSIAGAEQVVKADDPELFNVVEEMAIAAGLPMPDVYIIQDEALNAFATGKDPATAAVAITTGLRNKLSRDELQGVIAHEMGHVLNYDIRLMAISGVIGATITLACDMLWRLARGPYTRSSRRNNAGPIFVILAIVLSFVAPLIAKVLQLAVSRKREFLADATAVKLTRNPLGLASALQKLTSDTDPLDHPNRAMEHLYIVNPTNKLSAADLDSVWSTHPPIKERIRRILSIAS